MTNYFPRVMISGTGSGSGKTMVTCALLRILKRKGYKPAVFKCGPDYIDPIFHKTVLDVPSRNLDIFMAGKDGIRRTLDRGSEGRNFGVIEGVMGFYDGISASGIDGSSYDISKETETPVILVVNAKGMSMSIVPMVQGFCDYVGRINNPIKGIILNNISPMIADDISRRIEEDVHIPVVGYIPHIKDANIDSRHLGLVLPNEIPDLLEKIDAVADKLEETLNFDKLIDIAEKAEGFRTLQTSFALPLCAEPAEGGPMKVAVAKDEAFCFYYEDNFDLMRDMGLELEFFSPLHDKKLPDADGYIFGGGYPELYAKELSSNTSMLEDIKKATDNNVPIIAECGGFMYLQEEIEDKDGNTYKMVGAIPGKAFMTGKLTRFGYVTIAAAKDNTYLKPFECINGHEFHYYDTTNNGDTCIITKGTQNRSWEGIQIKGNLFAGFPHLYYPSCNSFIERFAASMLVVRSQKNEL